MSNREIKEIFYNLYLCFAIVIDIDYLSFYIENFEEKNILLKSAIIFTNKKLRNNYE